MKNQKYTLHREFNSEYHLWVSSWWHHCNVTYKHYLSRHHRSVIRFLREKSLGANAIQSGMHPVYGDKCFTRPTIHIWCKKRKCSWWGM